MADWRKLTIQVLLADGKIDNTEVKFLKKELWADKKIDEDVGPPEISSPACSSYDTQKSVGAASNKSHDRGLSGGLHPSVRRGPRKREAPEG